MLPDHWICLMSKPAPQSMTRVQVNQRCRQTSFAAVSEGADNMKQSRCIQDASFNRYVSNVASKVRWPRRQGRLLATYRHVSKHSIRPGSRCDSEVQGRAPHLNRSSRSLPTAWGEILLLSASFLSWSSSLRADSAGWPREQMRAMSSWGRWKTTGPCPRALPVASTGPAPGMRSPSSAASRPITLPPPRKQSCAKCCMHQGWQAVVSERSKVICLPLHADPAASIQEGSFSDHQIAQFVRLDCQLGFLRFSMMVAGGPPQSCRQGNGLCLAHDREHKNGAAAVSNGPTDYQYQAQDRIR